MRKIPVKMSIMMALMLVFMAFDFPEINRENHLLQSVADTTVIPEPCNASNQAFQDGEEVVYKIYYNWNFVWIPAGEVVFRVNDLGDQYHLSAKGRTYKSYDWFFKVRDDYDSYIDKSTLLPDISVRHVREGGYRLYDKVTFDQNSRKAKSMRGKTPESAKLHEFTLDDCMHDVLSIIYYARNINFNGLQEGQEIPIKIFLDKETYPLKVEYKGKEEKKRVKGNGKFSTHKFSPQLIAGDVFKEDDQMMVWVTDDENKLPLLIESPVSVGSVKAVLKSYKGLRHEFTAELD